MKKLLLLLVGLLLFVAVPGFAQVIADFEAGLNGFADQNWGGAMTALTQVADPTGTSAGVMSSHWAFTGTGDKDALKNGDALDVTGAQKITFWIYLPADIPGTIQIGFFAQDNKNWVWNESYTMAADVPKEKWYPITFDLAAASIKNPNFDIVAGKLFTGLQISNYGGAATVWEGDILIDNLTLIGVQPTLVADFETGVGDFVDKNFGDAMTSLTQVADPSGNSAGVLSTQWNWTGVYGKDALGVQNALTVGNARFITYWIWLPADLPDSIQFGVWAQDNKNWKWNETYTNAVDIPREKWFPISFDLAAAYAKDNLFDIVTGKLFTGLQISNANGNAAVWSGNIYVDNVAFLSEEVGQKWVLADFESEGKGTYGFALQGWGPAFTSLTNATDPGNSANRVMDCAIDLGTNNKGAFHKSDVSIWSDSTDTCASAITLDMWIPEDFPDGGQVGMYVNGTLTKDSWTEQLFFTTGPDSLKKGKWNKLVWDVVSRETSLTLTGKAYVGIQVYFATAPTWTGHVYFDNFTLVGIPSPAGALSTPATQGKTDTTFVEASNKIVDFVQLDWIDCSLPTAKYNIYASESPITDVKANGVTLVAPGIPQGLQKYALRPYSNDGAVKQMYYAVTATDDATETPGAAVGPLSIKTTPTFKIKYVKDFSTVFVHDGLNDEFLPYDQYKIIPESAGGPFGPGWTPESVDLNFAVTMVIDDSCLYISADVTDDDLNTDAAAQAWSGDALEFFMGLYDTRVLKEWHGKGFSNNKGDWRIGFTSNGDVALDGGSPVTTPIPGASAVAFQKLGGDGYIVEAKLVLDSLTINGEHLVVTNGMLMPLRMDCNDTDPTKGDAANTRTLQLGIGGCPTGGRVDLNEDWTRPHGWGFMEVIDGPTAIASKDDGLPTAFALYTNFPNPFNPSTTINYDLKSDVNVMLKVYNVLGQEVVTLVNERQKAGRYHVVFDASRYASGMYVYTFRAGTFVDSKKMMLVK